MGTSYSKYNNNEANIYVDDKRVAYGKYTHGSYFPHIHPPPKLLRFVNNHPHTDFYYIYNINVIPEHRRKHLCRNITRMLVKKILQESPNATILLHIRHAPGDIPPFRKCYEKQGFRYQYTEKDPTNIGKDISLFAYS